MNKSYDNRIYQKFKKKISYNKQKFSRLKSNHTIKFYITQTHFKTIPKVMKNKTNKNNYVATYFPMCQKTCCHTIPLNHHLAELSRVKNSV